ncbi:MAG TPA: dihydropteroate synthase [Nitrospira sp.]|jgi:dihydropteroate synthase|nr:dihydropteroate synthase [Nitrospira sp.]
MAVPMDLHLNSQRLGLDRPLLMGIVNVTPDSFSDGGRCDDPERAVAHAVRLVEEGADLLDLGAESTRPGALPVSEQEERRRLIPVVSAVVRAVSVPVSVDTSKAAVARAALEAGAVMINDVTALRGDRAMVDVVAETGAGLVLMHMQGTPETMQQAPYYDDVVAEIAQFLSERARFAMHHGVAKERIVLDPGIGFGKTLHHNLDLLANLHAFAQLGFPLLVGPSRKGFIGQLTQQSVERRAWGTAGAVALAVQQGANILRVHDVGPMKDVVRVASAVARRMPAAVREQHA